MYLRRELLPAKFLAWTLVFALIALSLSFAPVNIAQATPPTLPDVNDPDRLDKLLTELDKALDNLTDDEKQKLVKIKQDAEKAQTTAEIINLLKQSGLEAKLDKIIKPNLTFEQAQLTLKLLIPLTTEDWPKVKEQLKTLKQKYGQIINKLTKQNITENLLFTFMIKVNSKLTDLGNNREISESNFEVKLVQVVQELLKDDANGFKPIKDILIKAYNKLPPLLGSEAELFNPHKAPIIVDLINRHVNEISNPELTVVKDTFDLAKEIFEDIYIPKQTGGSYGSSGGGSSQVNEITTTVDVSKENKITLSGANFTLVVPAGAFEVPAGAEAKVVVKELTGEKAQQLFNDLVPSEQRDSYKRYGKVYNLEVLMIKEGVTTKITSFKKALTVEFPYDENAKETNQEKLAVWRFNDTAKEIQIVGGKVDSEKRVVSVPLNSFSLYGVMVYNKTFDDIKEHWARNDVEVLASRLIVKGITDKKFGPDLTVTRAEFAALLVRSLGLKEEAAIAFKDVPAGSWFAREVAKAVKAGTVKGYGNGKFQPNQKISREEMAVMIERTLKNYGKVKTLSVDSGKALEKFWDKAELSSWAQDSVAGLLEAGILEGRSDSVLAPKAVTTRAEAATSVKRLLNNL